MPEAWSPTVLMLTLLLPVGLLLLMLLMERVEEPIRARDTTRTVSEFLEHALPDELEQMITEGLDTLVGRYWKRRRRRVVFERRSVRRRPETATMLSDDDTTEMAITPAGTATA